MAIANYLAKFETDEVPGCVVALYAAAPKSNCKANNDAFFL